MTTEKIFDLISSFVKENDLSSLEVSITATHAEVHVYSSLNFLSHIIFKFLSNYIDELHFYVDYDSFVDNLRIVVYGVN